MPNIVFNGISFKWLIYKLDKRDYDEKSGKLPEQIFRCQKELYSEMPISKSIRG